MGMRFVLLRLGKNQMVVAGTACGTTAVRLVPLGNQRLGTTGTVGRDAVLILLAIMKVVLWSTTTTVGVRTKNIGNKR